jgi:hypothetical protein
MKRNIHEPKGSRLKAKVVKYMNATNVCTIPDKKQGKSQRQKDKGKGRKEIAKSESIRQRANAK